MLKEKPKIKEVILMFLCLHLINIMNTVVAEEVQSDDVYINPPHENTQQELMRLRNEGVAHFESGIALKKSIKTFEDALALSPDSYIESYNLGVAYRSQNEIEKAIKQFDKAIKINADFSNPYYTLGLIYREQNKVDDALNAFKKSCELTPAEPSCHYQLSRIYRELGDEKETLQYIINTLNLDPYHTGAIYQLYLYYQNTGDKEKADELFKEFSRLKKAFGKTRLEINADESRLSRPVDSRVESKTVINQPAEFIPEFSSRILPLNKTITAFDVTDFNRDGFDDLITASKEGVITYYKNNQNNDYELASSYSIDDAPEIFDIVTARLKQEGSTEFIAATAQGIFISSTHKDNEQTEESESKKKKKERVPFSINELNKNLVNVTTDQINNLVLSDIDHDGDLDIVADTFDKIFINNGDAMFEQTTTLVPAEEFELVKKFNPNFSGSDFRNQIMVDYVLHNDSGNRQILRDEMAGKYSLLNEEILKPIKAIAWSENADMNNDGWSEIVSLTPNHLHIDVNAGDHVFNYKNAGETGLELQKPQALIVDLNNDGFKDITVADEKGTLGVWIRNDDNYNFLPIQIEGIDEAINTDLQVTDSNNDGLMDILALSSSGKLYLLENHTQADKSHWVKLNLNGLRSAPDGQFVKVEVRYGDFYSLYEASDSNLHIPLGVAPHAEILRLTWPNGFVENKFKIDGNQLYTFDESERISGSCPSIYSWNDESVEYVTDAFISGPMGVPIGKDSYFPIDNDEYVKIPADKIQEIDNSYKISIVEELREVTYLDQVQIYAIDTPAMTDIYPNEYLNPPDFPSFKLYVAENLMPLASAFDHNGNDVLNLVSEHDYKYPSSFSKTQYTGLTSPHSVEFTLPVTDKVADNYRLFFTGWFYYFDSTSLISASQNHNIKMIMPELQAYVDDKWTSIKTIGIPSGKDKTIIVDLEGLIPDETEKLRVISNIEIYWDQIMVDTGFDESNKYPMVELPLKTAKMKFHGFSTLVNKVSDYAQPDRFDYSNVTYQSMWNPLSGNYTRYGDVIPLLTSEDSKMAVLGSGDEVVLEFDASSLKKLPPGWKRDFLLYLNGYVKDGDKYTVHSEDVSPMPFSGMETYPYSEKDKVNNPFNSLPYKQYMEEYQTRMPLRFTRVSVNEKH